MGNKDKIDALITVHSYSQMILYPYSFADQLAPNNDDLVRSNSFPYYNLIYYPNKDKLIAGIN